MFSGAGALVRVGDLGAHRTVGDCGVVLENVEMLSQNPRLRVGEKDEVVKI